MSPITVLIIVIVALVGTVGVIWAIGTWEQEINWNIPATTDFTVYDSLTGPGLAVSSITLASPPTDPTLINYYIENKGNVDIDVTTTIDFTEGDATVEWSVNEGTSFITDAGLGISYNVPFNEPRVHIILRLTDFSVGTGQAEVTFESAEST